MISLSIVSHGHGDMVCGLVKALLQYPEIGQIIVTENISENICLPLSPKLLVK